MKRPLLHVLAALVGLIFLASFKGCDSRPMTVPADTAAQELRTGERDASEKAAIAEAEAVALMRQGRDKEAAAKVADARLLRAIQAERNKLAANAETRAKSERQEIAEAAIAAGKAADQRRVWWISGLGLAASLAAAVLLARFLPLQVALGIPAAGAAFSVALAFWATWGAWILATVGILLLIAAGYLLARLLRVAIAEWSKTADHAAEPGSTERQEPDKASRARQPALERWILDHVFSYRPGVP